MGTTARSELSTQSEFLERHSYVKHLIKLVFDGTADVQTSVLAYDLDALLVEVGSSLGLWLGLSVVGIFDEIVLVLNKIQTLCNKNLC